MSKRVNLNLSTVEHDDLIALQGLYGCRNKSATLRRAIVDCLAIERRMAMSRHDYFAIRKADGSSIDASDLAWEE